MPQLLSRVRPNAKRRFYIGALAERPQLAASAMEAIHAWAEYETAMGRLVAYMIGSEAEPAIAILQSIVSGPGKADAVRAVAKAKLSEDLQDWLSAILRHARQVADRRHALAHHLWGVTPELPSALLLANPRDSIQQSVLTVKAIEAMYGPNPPKAAHDEGLRFDPAKIQVWCEKDFLEVRDTAAEATHWLNVLGVIVTPVHKRVVGLRHVLTKEPRFQAALAEWHQGQSIPVKPQKRPPPPSRASPRKKRAKNKG